ncbi:hypothetical protein HZB02_02810 [Candidatus Woesearchaeota archaeon]|nr:hypothetical protein [Candidatus Woesearchaeota archaeon]
MPELQRILKQIGLTDNESKVYITLLKAGNSSVSKLAKESGLYRPYVYDTLKRLLEKGLVSFFSRDNKKFFKAAQPSQLLEREKEKIQELEKAIPTFEAFLTVPKENANVELYSGKKVVRVVQKDVLKALLEKRGESLVIGVDEQRFMEADPIIMQQFFNQMKQNRLKERVLVREGDNYHPSYRETTIYRFLPKEHFSPNSIFVYGNNVSIILFTEPLSGIIIRSKELAMSYRKQFELLWNVAKKKP